MTEKIFVDGYITNDIADTLPPYILGKGAFHVKKLIKFLQDNEKYAVNGWINFSTLRSKEKGSRYTEIDLWAYNKKQESGESVAQGIQPSTLSADDIAELQALRAVASRQVEDVVKPEEIPF